MRRAGHQPELGESASALGVRVPHDIALGANNQVQPGTGGMSVSPSLIALRNLPSRMVPRRLRAVIPGAFGNDDLFVWSIGHGEWPQPKEVATLGIIVLTATGQKITQQDDLQLQVDPNNSQHGFVEPSASMSLERY